MFVSSSLSRIGAGAYLDSKRPNRTSGTKNENPFGVVIIAFWSELNLQATYYAQGCGLLLFSMVTRLRFENLTRIPTPIVAASSVLNVPSFLNVKLSSIKCCKVLATITNGSDFAASQILGKSNIPVFPTWYIRTLCLQP